MWRRAAQKRSRQASAEHFQQCTEFLPLRNRGLGRVASANSVANDLSVPKITFGNNGDEVRRERTPASPVSTVMLQVAAKGPSPFSKQIV
jgi:hypothetical protein